MPPRHAARIGGEKRDRERFFIWMYSPMLDRLRETDNGWRIAERYIGGSTTNRRLTPPDISAAAIRPFLPGA